MMHSQYCPIAKPNTIVARHIAHHSGHHEYGGKNPSSPAPSAISASLRSSGRGAILAAGKPRERGVKATRRVVMVSAEVPVQSLVISQYAGLTMTKKMVARPKIQASIFIGSLRPG